MGRNCTCCTQKSSESCCPENVFLDDNSAVLLTITYSHFGPDETINLTIDTEKTLNLTVLTFEAKKNTLHNIDIIFSNSESSIMLDGCGYYDCAQSNRYYTQQLNLNSNFDKDINQHKLVTKMNGEKIIGALQCIKRFTGDKDKLFNGVQPPNCFNVKIEDLELSEKVYYSIADYTYNNGEHWFTNLKYGCLCPCYEEKVFFSAYYNIIDNIDYQFDDCGSVDSYIVECPKKFFFTVTSKSRETGEVYIATDEITFLPLYQVVHKVKNGKEPEEEITHFIFPNQYYVPPSYSKHLKPRTNTDIIDITLDFSVSYEDCGYKLGCSNCPDGSREDCFCYKDSYSLSKSTFTFSWDSQYCQFVYDLKPNTCPPPFFNCPEPPVIYEVNIIRSYRQRNLSITNKTFTITISDIEFDYDTFFGFNFTPQDCKDAYTNLVKSFAGIYEFNLDLDCGSYLGVWQSLHFGEVVLPCECGASTGPGFNYTKLGQFQIGLGTCKGLASCGNSLCDGIDSLSAEVHIIAPRPGGYTNCFANTYQLPWSLAPIIYTGFFFKGSWLNGDAFECLPVNPSGPILPWNYVYSPCQGCFYKNKYINLSPIEYTQTFNGFSYKIKGQLS